MSRSLVAAQRYYYDGSERLSRMTETDASGELTHDYRWTYDHNNNVVSLVEIVGDETFTYTYSYNDDQIATGVDYGSTKQVITYDGYGRASSVEIKNNDVQKLNTTYTYNVVTEGETRYATNQIGTYTNTYGGADHNLTYTYDANGNITSVSDGTYTTTYTYNSLSQLTAEYNEAANKSWVYTYDSGGNIVSKTEYNNATATGDGTTISYTYGNANWGDLLTAYNGSAITYDGLGNPLAMDAWNFTWQGGRQLAGMTNGTTTLSFAYNDSGLRTSKTVGSTTHTYTYQGSALAVDKTATDALYFHYDQSGSILGFTYDDGTSTAEYYYVKNLQGDILGILDASGAEVASYSYDAWGNILTVNGSNSALANRNPIRYRGYYYDVESGLYYAFSRYYNPEISRFINSDDVTLVGANGDFASYNMFAYCGNNPILRKDDSGYFWETAFDVISLGLSIADVVSNPADPWAWASLAGDALDLIPFLTGVGEATKAIRAAKQVANASDAAASANRTGNVLNFVGGLCFVAGTLVLTSNGYTEIENIQVGDTVWSGDPETGETALKKVVQTYVSETSELVHLTINGEKVICTPEHPFYSPVKGWTAACKLRAGDILVTVNGHYVVVELVQHELLESPITVYNFEVEDFHTYYVGTVAALVHNRCAQGGTSRVLPRNGTTVNSSTALEMADSFLGPNYIEKSPGRFVSADGVRQVRMGESDILGHHAGGPHINFDILSPRYRTAHVYFFDD